MNNDLTSLLSTRINAARAEEADRLRAESQGIHEAFNTAKDDLITLLSAALPGKLISKGILDSFSYISPWPELDLVTRCAAEFTFEETTYLICQKASTDRLILARRMGLGKPPTLIGGCTQTFWPQVEKELAKDKEENLEDAPQTPEPPASALRASVSAP